jgi:hypothetical protein
VLFLFLKTSVLLAFIKFFEEEDAAVREAACGAAPPTF